MWLYEIVHVFLLTGGAVIAHFDMVKRCAENKIFLKTSLSSNTDIHRFLYWPIKCLQVDRMFVTGFWFHDKLVKKAKNIAVNYTYSYTINFSKREWISEVNMWTFIEAVFFDRQLEGVATRGDQEVHGPSTSISEPNKVQRFQLQTSGILLFTSVQK